ncbi:hypothetical protein, partial [Mycobacterium tuberculosis]
ISAGPAELLFGAGGAGGAGTDG